MSNMNFDILKQNVRNLMADNNLTQEKLGEKIKMSQSSVNKCLKLGDDSRNFTLEQVCKIAEVFDTTVDNLLGRQDQSNSYSPETVCRFFSSLIRNYQVVHFNHEVNEEVWNPYSNGYHNKSENRKVTYKAFYFPNYLSPREYFDEFRVDDMLDEVRAYGNELSNNVAINSFLQKFIDAFEKYDSDDYSKEDYDILIEAYYRILKK